MAIKMNLAERKQRMFEGKPDVEAKITLDDGVEHTWTIKNGGAMLEHELNRWAIEATQFQNIQGKVDGDDQEAMTKVFSRFNEINNRFCKAFKAVITSDDGSSDRWIDESISEIDVVILITTELIKEIKENDK